MPRIPTAEELGVVLPSATRQIGVADASGLARGVEALGNSLTEVADRWKAEDRVVGFAKAEAEKTDKTMALDRQLRENPDYTAIPDAARAGAGKITADAARFIPDPRDRVKWVALNQTDVARFSQQQANHAAEKERTSQITTLNDSLRQMGTHYADPTTPDEVREQAMKNIAGTIDMAEKTGLLAPDAASAARNLYVVKSKEQYLENLARSGGKMPDLGIVRPATPVQGVATAYGPGYGGQEGGPNDAQGRKVATLEDFAAGRTREITIAGNKQFEGRRYTIPSITFTDSSGQTKTLKNVPAVVTDTGDAFKAAPEGRFDIPVAANMAPDVLARQPFSKQTLSFIPEEQRQKSRIVSGDADMRNLSPSARGLLDGIAAAGVLPEIKVQSGYRDADRNAAAGGAKGSQHIHGNALDLDVGGLSDEQKSALLQAAIASGARGIGIYQSGNSIHVDTRETAAFWGPSKSGAYAGADVSEFPAWAQPHLQALRDGKVVAPPSVPMSTRLVSADQRFADVPYEKRLAAQQVYDATIKSQLAEQAAALKVLQTQTRETFQLGIQTDNPSVTQASILSNPHLDNGDKATLLKELETREKHSGVANLMGSLAASGQSQTMNPFDEDVRKGADVFMERQVKAGGNPLKTVDEIQQRFGVVPSKAVSALRGAIVGADLGAASTAATVAANMLMRNPNALAGDPGGDALARAAIRYQHYAQDLGYSPQKAAEMMQAADDPSVRAKVKITDDDAKAFQKEITNARSVTSLVGAKFDVSWWPGNPDIGQNDAVRSAMLNDFAEVAVQNLRDGMSKDEAKKMAAVQLGQIWGVTKLQGGALNGTVMKYAPEKRYAPAPDAKGEFGYGYFIEQARDFIKQEDGREVDPKDIRLMYVTDGRHGTLTTASAWDAKQPLPYLLAYSYKDETGQQRYAQMARPFVADPARAQKAMVDKVDATNVAARKSVVDTEGMWATDANIPMNQAAMTDKPADDWQSDKMQVRTQEESGVDPQDVYGMWIPSTGTLSPPAPTAPRPPVSGLSADLKRHDQKMAVEIEQRMKKGRDK